MIKKNILLLILIVISITLFADINYQNRTTAIGISYENTTKQTGDTYKVIAFPSQKVKIEITAFDADRYDENGTLVGKSSLDATHFVKIVKEFTMREFLGHEIKISNKITDRSGYSILNSVSFEVMADSPIKHFSKISKAFLPSYKALADNFDTSYLRNVDFSTPRILIIGHSSLSSITDIYSGWKRQKGTEVITANIGDIGDSSTDLKNYILDQYNSNNPPDYLLLIGDVDGAYTIPSYYITEENDVTDQIYTELAGNDYFPDMIVGRISVDAIGEYITIMNKMFFYEKTPYMDEPEWFKKALVIAGNYSSAPPYPTTPVSTSQWMADKFRDHGFEVDEIYYPPTYPGTDQIHAAICDGRSFVTYRGWGDANGWHFPEYHIGEGTEVGVTDLTNGYKLPVVTSIVCHTGDFANTYHDPCFGEAWIRTGTPTNPNGAVVFVGPSDLHTSTKFNNAIYAGFYVGLLEENIFDFGAAVLRGKVELFNNFPQNQSAGGTVEFYFRVYNILGDPNLQMWTDTPQAITATIPSSMNLSDNFLEINLPDLDGAVVTILKEDETYYRTTVENGKAMLYFNFATTGEATVTVTAPNRIPLISTITVNQQSTDVGLLSYDSNDEIIAGNTINLNLTVKNYGTATASNISGTLSTESSYANILTSSQTFGDISAGATSTQTYQIEIASNCPANESILFNLDLGENTSKFELSVSALMFEITGYTVNNANGYINPGESGEVIFHIKNISSFAVSSLTVAAQGTNAFTFENASYNLGDMAINETKNMPFTIAVASDCYVGRTLGFTFDITDQTGKTAHSWYHIPAGEVDTTAPTANDEYGYYAYDSFDTQYSQSPSYQWIEIDPEESGSGTVISMSDDASQTVSLPFDFKYYGETYDSLTICSNGWLSFVPTDSKNFRNWNIPGVLGPYAMLAPYWDDLIGEAYIENDETLHYNMNICYYYDTANHKFIIEWNNCYNNFDDTSLEKFEVVLYDPAHYSTPTGDGNILFNYHTASNPDANNNYVTVGIEDHTQHDGIFYTYANSYAPSATHLQNEMAILFTTTPPDDYTNSDNDNIQPAQVKFLDNYPNPFNPTTQIKFYVPNDNTTTEISIYNLKGEKVTTLLRKRQIKGYHSVTWEGLNENNRSVTSGIYMILFKSDNKVISMKKAILLK